MADSKVHAALPIPAPLVDLILLGPSDDRRQLQDSPILGDVWMAYAANASSVQDLLITPHKRSTAGIVASACNERLSALTPAATHSHQIAYLQGLVAAQLDLLELLQVTVPMTQWWVDRDIPRKLSNYTPALLRARLLRLFQSIKLTEGDGVSEYKDVPPLERYLALAGVLLWARRHPKPEGTPSESMEVLQRAIDEIDAVVEELLSLNEKVQAPEAGARDLIFNVSLNRRVSPAISRSVPAVKGDAARTLFKVDTSKIAWAVLDSGIDRTHAAFGYDSHLPKDTIPNGRVIKTFDFTRMRQISSFDSDRMDDAVRQRLIAEVGLSETEVDDRLEELRANAKKGRKIDWDIAEELLTLRNPPEPASAHGTHVAGIIGAQRPADSDHADGMCPEIQLYDFRVLAKSVKDTEYAVIAALQYIRYVNERHSYVTIHGANLSLSIPHNVRNYACGRTPVCNECQRLVESGVVVVAAAGNRGYQKFETKDGPFENYAAFSITDPGNADDVITVGATHGNGPHTYGVSFFSSRGPTGDGRPKPDLVAPGERILAPIPEGDWGAESGTSMAAPHVSGAAAMLMARYPELIGNPRRIKRILCESATNLDRERSFQGAGMLDVLRAFQSI